MDIPFLRCFPESGGPFKISKDSKSCISKTAENWALCASSIHGKEVVIREFEKQVDAEYARLCLDNSLSKGDEKWDAETFKSLSDSWGDAANKLSSDESLDELPGELPNDQHLKNIKSLMKSSKFVITNGEIPILITIKYPIVCKEAWDDDMLKEYHRKIMCVLSLECPYYITWEEASLEFQEHSSERPDELW